MGYVTENDYKTMSEAVAEDLIRHKIPLNDSIQKLASSRDLNHEQVARLCETANNATFNKMFQGRDKTAEDRIIEFDVADPKQVLGGAIKEAAVQIEEDEDDGETIYLSDFRSLKDIDDHPVTKIAEAVSEDDHVRPEQARRTVEKTLKYLRSEKIAAQMLYEDALVQTRLQFKRLYNDLPFENFEKQAAALHQECALQPLGQLRSMMRLPQVTYDFGVLEKNAGYIDDSPIVFKLFSNAVEQAQKLDTLTRGIEKLEERLR